jgi:hypothetical protein
MSWLGVTRREKLRKKHYLLHLKKEDKMQLLLLQLKK